jgi:hypothetical protein
VLGDTARLVRRLGVEAMTTGTDMPR